MKRTITFAMLCEAAENAYRKAKTLQGGRNAHYIPYLANVDPDLFGISIVTPDGGHYTVGDTDYRFGIESVSKVPTALLILKEIGPGQLLEKIGADATGLKFNSIFALLLENDHPSTPLVNAGAITACSLIEPTGDADAKWKKIVANMTALMGSEPILIDELYKSESDTNFQNRSISWLLKQYGRIYDDPMMSLDLYTRQCSLGVTTDQLANMAGTIAFDGTNPLTGTQVFNKDIARRIVTLMATVGFYQHTGDWLYTSGLPAKTGVGGAVMGILPGLFGICAFSPPLDDAGNSVRAQAAIRDIMESLDLNVFNNDRISLEG